MASHWVNRSLRRGPVVKPDGGNLSENLAKNFAKDGWFRRDYGPWSLLLHASPEGWSFLPGHGHRDFGGFELHADGLPLLCDLGRRSYGPSGGGDVAATMHNTIIIDENEPYPMNRPYYDARFRNYIAGPNPEVLLTADGVSLQTRAFARLGASPPGIGRGASPKMRLA